MGLNDEPWQFDSKDLYVPITYEGRVLGFGKPKFATRVVEVLNEEDKLRKALEMACLDLLSQAGSDQSQVNELVKQYIAKVERPKSGTGAIAALLRDRQAALDISDQEFARFCDTYRLSRSALNNIYAGEKISDSLLTPLARIIGMSVEEIVAVRDGNKAT